MNVKSLGSIFFIRNRKPMFEKGKRKMTKRLFLTISAMLIVMVLAMWMLEKNYSEINFQTRAIISAGASVLSGLISYILFRDDKK
jgi:peptidoglycan biosynthesis protein MviN/MurJ (putative lipid II flippase)